MTAKGTATREMILDRTLDLVLENGFAATSIEMILQKTGLTKGAFFYYFKSKLELGHALVERQSRRDAEFLVGNLRRAEGLSRDPLQQLLIFIGLFIEDAEKLTNPHEGCLFASYVYESTQFDDQTRQIITRSFAEWRIRVGEKLRLVLQNHVPRIPVDPDSLAEFLNTTFEGAFLLSKTYQDSKILADQLRHYRNYLEALFSPVADNELRDPAVLPSS